MTEVRTFPDVVPPENRTLGWAVLAWTADWLLQPDGPNAGSPWAFTREQVRILLRWYQVDDAGRFAYRRGVLRRMKGWGKDPFLAAIAAVELCGPCRFGGWDADGNPVAVVHPAPWVQVAAVSKDQTRNTMTLFPGMLSPAAVLEYGLDLGKEIIHSSRGGRIEAVTSSPRALEGGRPSLVIANETHHWLGNNDGHEMANAIRRNLAKSRDGSARSMEITNAHLPGEESVAEQSFLGWQSGDRAGVYYDSVEPAPLPAALPDVTDEQLAAALEVARCDSHWVDIPRLIGEIRDPGTPPSLAMRFYLNQVVATEALWCDPDAWHACKADKPVTQGDRVCLGFDGSISNDSTALVAVRLDDGHAFPVGVWERPKGRRDWQVDRVEVNKAVREAFEAYQVVRLYLDPAYWQESAAHWQAEFGQRVMAFPNTDTRMIPALEQLHTAITTGEFTHSGDRVLTAHVLHAVAVEKRAGVSVRKRTFSEKIDALMALTMAFKARSDAIAAGELTSATCDFFAWDEL